MQASAAANHAPPESPSTTGQRRAGFWQRVAATTIDLLLVYILLRGVESLLLQAGIYIPFEATFLLAWLVYAVTALGLSGTSIGRWMCGLRVETEAGQAIGWTRAIFRESAGKALATLPLFAGLFAAARPSKRGLQDRLAGTVVVRCRVSNRARGGMVLGLFLAFLLPGLWVVEVFRLFVSVRPILPTQPRPSRYAGRDPRTLIDVSGIDAAHAAPYQAWLDAHAEPAADFVLDRCRRYPVVIVGERHWQARPLRYLSDLLPRLYHESGVRCVGMEWLLADENERIDRLLRADAFDERLAIEMARHQSWETWGWKEYVDVLKAAWQLNRGLGSHEPKIQVVGLDLPIDLPSAALAGLGDDAVEAPPWERLRIVRLVRELPKMLLRDAYMARQVELNLLIGNRRGIVWVGAAHSVVNCRSATGDGSDWGRMGFMLKQKYPSQVFQIAIHGAFGDPAMSSRTSALDNFLSRVMEKHGGRGIGFEPPGSPFDGIRDGQAWPYRNAPAMSLGDLTSGYLFLGADQERERCEWLEAYVTQAMFVRNRAFYAAKGRQLGMTVRSAADANRALRAQ